MDPDVCPIWVDCTEYAEMQDWLLLGDEVRGIVRVRNRRISMT